MLAKATAAGEHWQLEQVWSPSSRAAPLVSRTAAPYLAKIVNGRAQILDYGIQNTDGSWRLASGAALVDANGIAIPAPTKADILAQAHPTGQEWRTESFGYNRFATIPVPTIALDIVKGNVADYTVQVTDQDGIFYVWARNLDRALALQDKQGNARAFNLRNYAVDFGAQGHANDNVALADGLAA